MKNLELKIKININKYKSICKSFKKYYVEDLIQTDTYYKVSNGRLKLREEKGKSPYVIYYNRPNQKDSKISSYYCFNFKNIDEFKSVFDNVLTEELVVEKVRSLFLYENARIHLDKVKSLGYFLEIEVVIRNKDEDDKSQLLMDKLIRELDITDCEKISIGYRELTLAEKHRDIKRDLKYYANQNKVFWYVNGDINDDLKNNDVIPCIFIEIINKEMYIIQLDESILDDDFKYTAWRKTIGMLYGTYIDVLLIKNNKLYTLNDKIVKFNNLKRSDLWVDKKFLAKFI